MYNFLRDRIPHILILADTLGHCIVSNRRTLRIGYPETFESSLCCDSSYWVSEQDPVPLFVQFVTQVRHDFHYRYSVHVGERTPFCFENMHTQQHTSSPFNNKNQPKYMSSKTTRIRSHFTSSHHKSSETALAFDRARMSYRQGKHEKMDYRSLMLVFQEW